MVKKKESNKKKSEKSIKTKDTNKSSKSTTVNTRDDRKTKSMRTRFPIIISIIIIICIIGFAFVLLSPASESISAQLIIDSGTVQLKHAGESWITAENGMLLYQSDSIKTGDETSASIVLFQSSVIRLDSNTEVTIQELIKKEGETSVSLKQDAGRTWNTISKISGIDDYDVQTSTTVASVRGTAFDVNIKPDGKTAYRL